MGQDSLRASWNSDFRCNGPLKIRRRNCFTALRDWRRIRRREKAKPETGRNLSRRRTSSFGKKSLSRGGSLAIVLGTADAPDKVWQTINNLGIMVDLLVLQDYMQGTLQTVAYVHMSLLHPNLKCSRKQYLMSVEECPHSRHSAFHPASIMQLQRQRDTA